MPMPHTHNRMRNAASPGVLTIAQGAPRSEPDPELAPRPPPEHMMGRPKAKASSARSRPRTSKHLKRVPEEEPGDLSSAGSSGENLRAIAAAAASTDPEGYGRDLEAGIGPCRTVLPKRSYYEEQADREDEEAAEGHLPEPPLHDWICPWMTSFLVWLLGLCVSVVTGCILIFDRKVNIDNTKVMLQRMCVIGASLFVVGLGLFFRTRFGRRWLAFLRFHATSRESVIKCVKAAGLMALSTAAVAGFLIVVFRLIPHPPPEGG